MHCIEVLHLPQESMSLSLATPRHMQKLLVVHETPVCLAGDLSKTLQGALHMSRQQHIILHHLKSYMVESRGLSM